MRLAGVCIRPARPLRYPPDISVPLNTAFPLQCIFKSSSFGCGRPFHDFHSAAHSSRSRSPESCQSTGSSVSRAKFSKPTPKSPIYASHDLHHSGLPSLIGPATGVSIDELLGADGLLGTSGNRSGNCSVIVFHEPTSDGTPPLCCEFRSSPHRNIESYIILAPRRLVITRLSSRFLPAERPSRRILTNNSMLMAARVIPMLRKRLEDLVSCLQR